MKKVFVVEIAFDDSEFNLDRLNEDFVQGILKKYVGGRGVEIHILDVRG